MPKNELSWYIGGAQGTGIESVGNISCIALGKGGLNFFTKREFESNIKGKHSYTTIRVSNRPVGSHLSYEDLLTSYDNETVVAHLFLGNIGGGGGIIYDPSLVWQDVSQIRFLEKELAERIKHYLKSKGRGTSVDDVLKDAEERGIKLFPIPYKEIRSDIAKKAGKNESELRIMNNIISVGASFGLMEYDKDVVHDAIEYWFKKKQKIIPVNIEMCDAGFDYAKENYSKDFGFKLEKRSIDEPTVFIDNGTKMAAFGMLLGGYRFHTWYPITPASDKSVFLESISNSICHSEVADLSKDFISRNYPMLQDVYTDDLKKLLGGTITSVQTEDEIAAIAMATGAALTGARSGTATSGPGLCLMVEAIGWGKKNEVPVFIADWQRAGPATGMPTRHEQGDLKFVLNMGHGESPLLVVAPGDHKEYLEYSLKSLNWMEMYQMPVVVLYDKAGANSGSTIPLKYFDSLDLKIRRGDILAVDDVVDEYRRFRITDSGISPRAFLGQEKAIAYSTGDESDEHGHITEASSHRIAMMDKRMRKLDLADREIPDSDKIGVYGDANADITLITWGSNKPVILDAMQELQKEHTLNLYQFRVLNPFPVGYAKRLFGRSKKIIDVEMNYTGQLADIVQEKTCVPIENRILKYNGRIFSEDELVGSIREVLKGKRMVMTGGV